jgi:perosamine synthetase
MNTASISETTEKFLPLSVPQIEGNAWTYVKECLDTQWVSSVGSFVGRFEQAVCKFTGSRFAVAGVNGTACLHVALEVCGVGPGDAVLTPALTFIATANSVTYTGASCVFIDCEPTRLNMDLAQAAEFLERKCKKTKAGLMTRDGRRMKAILATHILGYPMEMDKVAALAKKYGLIVVEDAAEAVGSFWRGRHMGTFGKTGALSFNGNKIITTGGGGMMLTSDPKLAKRASFLTQQAKSDPNEYIHDAVGYNYRMTNVAAALGVSQMESLPGFLEKRATIAGWYAKHLPGVPVEPIPSDVQWNRWLLSVQVPSKKDRDALQAALAAAKCQARPLWRPIPDQKPYRGASTVGCAEARQAYNTILNIPSATQLTEADVARVCRVLATAPAKRFII